MPDAETSNHVDHAHTYVIKGRVVHYAECSDPACRHKLNHGNGVVVGSKQKLEREVKLSATERTTP